MTMVDDYWINYDLCLDRILGGVTAEELIRTCNEHFDKSVGDAFFPGGGDRDMLGTLLDTGWSPVWVQAAYYFAARDRDGATITYVEGDIYRGTQRPGGENANDQGSTGQGG
jgi:hypothetical protein